MSRPLCLASFDCDFAESCRGIGFAIAGISNPVFWVPQWRFSLGSSWDCSNLVPAAAVLAILDLIGQHYLF